MPASRQIESFLGRPWWQQPSFALVLILGISLSVYPFIDVYRPLRTVVQLLDVAVVLIVVRVIRCTAGMFSGNWMLAVPLVGLQITHLFVSSRAVDLALLIAQIVFFLYAILTLLMYVLDDDVVTLDELFALAGMYVLIAMVWASSYAIVVHFVPDAIFINETNNAKKFVGYSDLIYYSMTTLTSTGYGEITPVHPAARALAMLQQWVGVMYVGILIARLAGMHKFRRIREGAPAAADAKMGEERSKR
jgi:hypothetical protein